MAGSDPQSFRGERWRLLPTDTGSTVCHIALSDALVRHVTEPALWWHSTERPALILGAAQPLGDVDLERCAQAGVLVLKRHAGGTAVFAGPGVLGLDVALPRGHPLAPPDVLETYRWLGEIWVDALRSLDVDARLVTIAEARAARSAPNQDPLVRLACFGALSPYEVTVGDRKLVGLAQVRRSAGILLQAGLHLRFDADGLADLLSTSDPPALAGALSRAAIGVAEASGRDVAAPTIHEAFRVALQTRFQIEVFASAWTDTELAHAEAARVIPFAPGL